MRPADLGFSPARFPDFRCYAGFDQLQTALHIATDDAHRFQILNAATGSGKSLTGATVAALTNARVLVLTATKELQGQYVGDGLVKRSVTGHRNYWCASRSWTSDAEPDDPDYRCSVPRTRCNWWGDVQAALASRSVITNYAFWLSIGRYGNPDLLGDFDLLVCDESHEAKSWLSKALTITITRRRLDTLLGARAGMLAIPRKIEQVEEWAGRALDTALDRAAHYRRDDPERKKLDRLIGDLERLIIATNPDSGLTEPWIAVPLDDGRDGRDGVSYVPRWGADFSEQLLFRGIPRVLLMSATVSRHDARYLGIPDGKWAYREIPSPFDVRRRPVVWVPTVRVDFRMSDGAKYKLHRRVDEIVEAAVRENAGNVLIHTGSYERNRELMAATRFAPLIITHGRDSADFKRALEQFKGAGRGGRFAVFASPRAQEGIDLPDDLAHIVIVMKVPFPYTLDPLTAARVKEEGYRNLAVAESMMQMCGRAVRGAGDWATTFVLDDHFAYMRCDMPVPEWFRAGFQKRAVDEGEGFGFLSQAIVDSLPPLPPPPENRVTFLLPV